MSTYQHLTVNVDHQNIVWLALAARHQKLNLLNQELLAELEQFYQQLGSMNATGLIVYSTKPQHFMVGPDVHLLQGDIERQTTAEFLARAQQMLHRFAELPIPSVALLNGSCLAGGLEFALALDYRIATDTPATRIGFPEIKLGFHPSLGGFQRAMTLAGTTTILQLMLSGELLSAHRALQTGLVDALAPIKHLKAAGKHYIEHQPAQRKNSLNTLLNNSLLRPLLAARVQQRLKASSQHAPTTAAANFLRIWRNNIQSPALLAKATRDSITELAGDSSTQNLTRLFLLRKRLRRMGDKTLFTPQHIHLVGAGVFGRQIALCCAEQGLSVSLQDQSHVLEQAQQWIQQQLTQQFGRHVERIASIENKLILDKQGQSLAQADVVIEAIHDKLAAKQELFAHVEEQASKKALLVTVTSCLPLEKIAAVMLNPQRLVGIQFFYPVSHTELAEISHIPGTTDTHYIALACAMARHLNKLPLPVENNPGYMVNRILFAYILHGIHLHQQQVPHTILDKAARDFGMPYGPLELADALGLDYCHQVGELLAKLSQLQLPEMLSKLLRQGKLGQKSGSGFYRYRNGRMLKPERAVWEGSIPALQEKLVGQMAEEAALCLEQGIVEEAELLDAAIVLATGFAPTRGGPLHFTRSLRR